METLRQASHSVLGILNDTLDLSKIEAGKMSIEVAQFNLETELTEVADLFKPLARVKSTVLHLIYPPAVPRWFVGDRPRIRQIVANFTSNSVKFTENGEVWIAVEGEDAHVRISVRDTGIGIGSEALPRLFSRFVQAEPSVGHGGTGLGLAISKQLAELMGGRVGGESLQGQGSTFWVELPLKPAEHPLLRGVPVGPHEFPLAGSRVLVAEDNEASRDVLSKLLERHGMMVDVVASGTEAVTRFGQTNYSVILMDCQMPQMDGCEATRKIRELEAGQGKHTPVIAITALAMTSERNRCQAAGMDDFLVKPVVPAQILECIARHIADM